MEFKRKLTGTNEEMEELFDKFNVRFYKKVNNKFEVILRVSENFKIPKIKTLTIKEMKESLINQNEFYKN
ncbi:hypothetical protein PJV97_11505 [Aliarcobacter butzleri]|uniref:hypothetical protein n=1 Tax=Aliarcobacter butzleri TaxID=28197 RepID=UPI00263ECCCD|nr:hypothetical protein [Aliarcobacter butzleri]MDN5112966.1 hypothetical protein [Aliarcobacter butzleri]